MYSLLAFGIPSEEEMFLAVEHQAVEQFSIAFGVHSLILV